VEEEEEDVGGMNKVPQMVMVTMSGFRVVGVTGQGEEDEDRPYLRRLSCFAGGPSHIIQGWFWCGLVKWQYPYVSWNTFSVFLSRFLVSLICCLLIVPEQ